MKIIKASWFFAAVVAGASFFLPGGSAQSCPATCSNVDPTVYDVLIVGGGMAGVKAADRLSEFADISYLLLEANDVLGGRMKNAMFEGTQIELGANWIEGGSVNPILDLANQFGVDNDKQFFTDRDTYENQANGVVKPVKSKDVTKEQNTLRGAYNNCLTKEGNLYYETGGVFDDAVADPGAKAVLRDQCGWDPATPLQKEINWNAINYEFAYNAEDVSLASFPDETFRDYNKHRMLVYDQSGGFKDVAVQLAQGLNFQLDTTVDCIEWQKAADAPQLIYTHKTSDPAQCTVFKAMLVIYSPSVGTYTQNANLFQPPMSTVKDMSKNVFEMGLYYKVFYKFNTKFWPDQEFIQIVNSDPNTPPGYCSNWQNLDIPWFLPGSKILFCTVTTEVIESFGSNGEIPQAKLDEFVQPLYEAYNVPTGDRTYVNVEYYNWKADTKTFGSWENWKVGGKLGDYFDFFKPLEFAGKPKVYLSGSASCFRYWGFVHGAYEAGLRSANQALFDLGKPVITTSICDDYQ